VNLRIQRVCAWTGPALCVVFFTGFAGVAHWMPPPNPLAGPEEIAGIFRERPTAILLGQVVAMTAIGFLTVWAAAISAQLRRIDGAAQLANAQLGLAAISSLVFIVPQFFWVTAAFRPERDPAQLWLLNDLGWLPFVANVYTGVPWVLVIALAVLSDRGAPPVFPRWAGYYCVWLAVVFLPASLALFIKQGVFAWNGFVVFWLPIVFFGSFLLVFSGLLLRAISAQAAGEPSCR
jgi:hypothetical protein